MKRGISSSLSGEIIAKIQKHTAGAENLSSRKMPCHYCEHKTIVVYEDSHGHIGVKCKKCGKEGVYNVRLRRKSAFKPYCST